MRVISHRGNVNGSTNHGENHPDSINEALKLGYYVEVDVWKQDDSFYLGHDMPEHPIDKFYLFNSRFYIHCKNREAFEELSSYSQIDCFFHEDDSVCLTTKQEMIYHGKVGYPVYPGRTKSIAVDLDHPEYVHSDYHGVITDYPEVISVNVEAPPFELLVLDIDGVMTDGTKVYGLDAKAHYKRYCDKDFTAIKRFMAAGVKVVFLSGDKTVNENMAKSRGVDFYHSRDLTGNIDKARFIDFFKEKYDVGSLAYVGDDYYDLTMLDRVDVSFCPSDAAQDVLNSVDYVLKTPSGEGVVAEIFEWAKGGLNLKFPYDSHKVNP